MRYNIMFFHRNYGTWEVIRTFDNFKDAAYELDRLKRGIFGQIGILQIKEVECK